MMKQLFGQKTHSIKKNNASTLLSQTRRFISQVITMTARNTFKWNNLEISYIDEGRGETIVLIHAFPLNARMWEHQIVALRDDFRVIALDLPGFGMSHPAPTILSMELAADVVNALAEHLQIERLIIGGLSMGGYVTMAFARKYPEMIERMILANTRATADTEEARQKREAITTKVLNEGTEFFISELLDHLLGETTKKTHPDIVAKVKTLMTEATPSAIAAAQRGVARRRDSFDTLQRIDVPALVIASDEDIITPKSEAEAMTKSLKSATLFTIGKCGHLSNIEAPKQFNIALKSFIMSDVE